MTDKEKQKQHLINMMQEDEKLGLYEEPKQTAVYWFAKIIDNVLDLNPSEFVKIKEAFQQAIEMEKQQIKEANIIGVNQALYHYRNAEQYYNETYKKNDTKRESRRVS